MNSIYPLMTIERLPDTMSAKDVKELMAYITITVVRSKDFARLDGLRRATVVDFCMSVQDILLTAYGDLDA